jgi:hypothetical protein
MLEQQAKQNSESPEIIALQRAGRSAAPDSRSLPNLA